MYLLLGLNDSLDALLFENSNAHLKDLQLLAKLRKKVLVFKNWVKCVGRLFLNKPIVDVVQDPITIILINLFVDIFQTAT